ncbi:MAG: alpha/beta fold hydrolase, partial [Gammaproteobacteria bacterium]|nr:alpha/beta fold hydrolase [Gammaproteobacteria bacterium]
MLKKILIVVAVLVAADLLAVFLFPGAAYQLAMDAERALAGLHTREIEVDGIRYSYTDSDEGEPLLLLHGFTADKDHWTRVARHLTDKFRVIAPDLPGFGASTRDPQLDYSIDAQAQRVAAFADALGLQQFHLGGSSMGGAIAAVLSARYPQRVQSLWLLAPGGVTADEVSDMESMLLGGGDHPLIPASREEFEATLDFVFEKRPFLPGPLRRHLSEVAAERQQLRLQIFAD